MATASPAYNPALNNGSSVPLTLDGTGDAASVPITVKNGKSNSGVELWATGTAPTGYILANSTGTLQGVFGLAVAANDWITGTAASDMVIAGLTTKKVHFGLNAGVAPAVTITLTANANPVVTVTTSNAVCLLFNGVADNYLQKSNGDLYINTTGGTNSVYVRPNGNNSMQWDQNGNTIFGPAAVATNATAGFPYIPSCAGTPTGAPAAITGRRAIVWDSTNKKLYVFDGTWLGGTVPGAFT